MDYDKIKKKRDERRALAHLLRDGAKCANCYREGLELDYVERGGFTSIGLGTRIAANIGLLDMLLLLFRSDAICQECRLIREVDDIKARLRERKEETAIITRDVLAEYGLPTTLEQIGETIGKAMESLPNA